MITIISFIIVIGIIVFIHELGHFIAAKLSGVRVEEFSLGFPPKMISRKVGETEYQLAWIPLGGYVKLSGMLDESLDENYNPDDPRGFMKQPLIRKVFIIVSGVLMNLLLAWIIYSGLIIYQGVGTLSGTTITMVSPDFPAAEAGIIPGDRIVEINGRQVDDWQQMTEEIRQLAGIPTTVSWFREDSLMTAEIMPKPMPDLNLTTMKIDTVGKIGVMGTIVSEPVGPLTAIGYGALQVFWIQELSFKSLVAIITSKVSIREIAGPIGIARMSGETARSGLLSFLGFIAMISSAVAFMNILPIPMLDGGHLIFIFIEAAIRRPIPEKLKINLIRLGFAAIILLLIVVSYNDVIKIFKD